MSRKLILTLATAATIAASALASSAADARGFGGGGGGFGHSVGIGRIGGGGGLGRIGGGIGRPIGGIHRLAGSPFPILLPPGHHGPGLPPPWWHHHHHHWHWWFRDGRWVAFEGGIAEPVVGSYAAPVMSTPGPCTCLTKSYTQDGMVVFADLCTKESAAAPVDGRAADATPAPQEPSAPPAPAADDKASDATPMQNPSNFAGRTYKDFLAANGLPMPQGAQGN
jgi:hypothetical protein